jgi:hypothetical protein
VFSKRSPRLVSEALEGPPFVTRGLQFAQGNRHIRGQALVRAQVVTPEFPRVPKDHTEIGAQELPVVCAPGFLDRTLARQERPVVLKKPQNLLSFLGNRIAFFHFFYLSDGDLCVNGSTSAARA